jgi:hypothetical protein
MPETKNVPRQACRMVSEVQFGDNGAESKTAPIRLLARSGNALDHWFWGRIVHDLSGMQMHKARLPVDYCHESNEVLGYLNHFDISDGDLVASGALTPFKDGDRASEVIFKSRNGVPWEASIDWAGPAEIEELEAGQFAEVNGRQVEGPAQIVRRWQLRGVAVCPYGADMNTESKVFSGSETVAINIKRSSEMAEQAEAVEVTEAVEAEVTEVEEETVEAEATEEAAAVEPVEQAVETPAEEAQPVVEPTEQEKLREQGKAFVDAFGERGAVWFLEGKTFTEAQALRIDELQAEVERLTALVSEKPSTASGVSRTDAAPESKPKSFIRIRK